jgi:hypothetical protein
VPTENYRGWTLDDLPVGPYLHGTRRRYEVGELLLTDIVSGAPGEEDDRQMCFATVSLDEALDWAYRRGIRHGGDTLYVYEIEMDDPQVDVNMHGHGDYTRGTGPSLTSVMSHRGRILRLAHEIPVAEYTKKMLG